MCAFKFFACRKLQEEMESLVSASHRKDAEYKHHTAK